MMRRKQMLAKIDMIGKINDRNLTQDIMNKHKDLAKVSQHSQP